MAIQTARIRLQNVSKSFGAKKVLQNIALEVNTGESLAIIGGSGTGKSVLLKCILGLLQADTGSIQIDRAEISKASSQHMANVRQKIGMLFQGAALFDSLPVWENIFFGPLQKGLMSRGEARRLAPDHLAAVGLQREVCDLYPAELSGGMQRRVGIARTVASRPEILFFDEPTAGLDPVISSVINDLISQNVKKLGATAITITHDMISARKIADRVIMLHQGRIVWQGPIAELDTTDNPYIRQFIHGNAEGPINVNLN